MATLPGSLDERFKKQLDFILEIDKVKSIFRQNRIFDGSRQENDAEHGWHLALMALVLLEYANEPGLDLAKVIKMVLIHDIVEIDAGDVLVYDTAKRLEAAAKEKAAARRIFGLLPPKQRDFFIALWEEFETRVTPEAKFAAALDRVEPILQNYMNQGYAWKKHGIHSDQVIEKNQHIQNGSQELWGFIKDLIHDAVEKGYLKK